MAYTPKDLEDLIKRWENITNKRFDLFDPSTKTTAKEIADSMAFINASIKEAKENVEEFGDSFSRLRKDLQESVKKYSEQKELVRDIVKDYSKITDITRQLEYDEKDIYELNIKQLKVAQSRISGLRSDIKLKAEQLIFDNKELLNKRTGQLLSDKYLEKKLETLLANKKISREEYNIVKAYKDGFKEIAEIEKKLKKRLELEYKINKALGVTGFLYKGISSFLQKIGVDSYLLEEVNKKIREAAKSGNAFKVAGVAIKETFKVIGASLLDPVFMLGQMIKLFKFLKDIAVSFSARTFDIAKTFAITSDSAFLLNKRFSDVAVSSNNILVNQKSLLQATKDINERYGTNAMLTEKILTGQIELVDKLGLQGAEAAVVTEYSLKTGKSQAQIVESITKQNKGVLNNRKVLEATLKVSGQLYAQYKGDVEQIAKAVVQAQKLGLTLEETANISRNLLNFESSISAELEAEILTGQDLNLEKARYLALQGKSAEAAAELLSNLGPNGLLKFQGMNIIQQDALAKAIGMTSDQVVNSYRTQQAISRLTLQDRSAYKEAIKDAQNKGDYDRAAALEKEMSQGKEFKMAKLNLDAQTKFNKAVEKMKAILTSIVEGPLGKMAETIANMMEKITKFPAVTNVLKFAIPLLGLLTGGLFLASLTKGVLFPMRVIVMNPGFGGGPLPGLGGPPLTPAYGPMQNPATRAASLSRGARIAGGVGSAATGLIGGTMIGGGGKNAMLGSMLGTGLGALGYFFGPAAGMAGMALGGMLGGGIGGMFDKPQSVKDAKITPSGLIAAKYSEGKIKPIAQGLPNDNLYFSTNKPAVNNNATNMLLTQLITETKTKNNQQIIANVNVDNNPTIGTPSVIRGIKNTYKVGAV